MAEPKRPKHKVARPMRHLTEGQRSDFKGADVLLKDLPQAETLISDRGYDSTKIRKAYAFCSDPISIL